MITMEVSRTEHTHIVSANLQDIYSHNIQLYLEDITIGTIHSLEFEDLALKRLHLYRIIKEASKEGHEKYSVEWCQCIVQNLGRSDLKTFFKLCEKEADLDNPTEFELQARKIDYISHFILRYTCSNDIKLRKWFIMNEAAWFYIRYQKQTAKGKEFFFKLNKLNYIPIGDEEKCYLWEYLKDIINNDANNIIYKIKLMEALSIIKYRRVYLQRGYAFVPDSQLVFCIINRFKEFLNTILQHVNHNIDLMNEQLNFLLQIIRQTINTGDIFIESNNKHFSIDVELSKMNTYAQKNFPLCMKHVYQNLKADHHLKYGGRLQLGNFIKNIGINLEDSIQFWKSEFMYNITETAFEKNYLYNIKHIYGTVGRMKEYTPESCENIICRKIGPAETHGCPFKTWDSSYLAQKLEEDGLSQRNISTILEETLKGHCESACTKHFKFKHNRLKSEIVKYPHEYFKDSLTITGCSEEEECGDEYNEEIVTTNLNGTISSCTLYDW